MYYVICVYRIMWLHSLQACTLWQILSFTRSLHAGVVCFGILYIFWISIHVFFSYDMIPTRNLGWLQGNKWTSPCLWEHFEVYYTVELYLDKDSKVHVCNVRAITPHTHTHTMHLMFVLAAEGRDKGCVAPLQAMIWCCQLKRNNSWWKIKNMNHVKCIYCLVNIHTHFRCCWNGGAKFEQCTYSFVKYFMCLFFVSLRQMILNAWSLCDSI